MTRRTKKIILFCLIALLAIGSGIVYCVWNKPHKDVKHTTAIKVAATVLYKAFSTDSLVAKLTYTDKVLEVSGEVLQNTLNQQGQQVVLLKTDTPDASVNCTMEEDAVGIKQGDNVAIKGVCSGYIAGDPEMDLPGDVFIIRGYHLK